MPRDVAAPELKMLADNAAEVTPHVRNALAKLE
jgi:hypothetical protein